MAIQAPEFNGGEISHGKREITDCLDDLRREIGALRHEVLHGSPAPARANEESYRTATQIDLLVSKMLRLQSFVADEAAKD
ncbi:MAG: hypothetical protein ACM3ZC_17445 [Bacteroidota bacterium]